MRRLSCFAVALALLFDFAVAARVQVGPWVADKDGVRRLPPEAFGTLPATIRDRLQGENCMVPQSFAEASAHNLIRGEFARKGRRDWAVLCSSGGKSSIRVFWGGPVACSSSIAAEEDANYIQQISRERRAYSRMLAVATPGFIAGRNASLGFRPIHAGIEDRFVEKGSVVHFCHDGKWMKLDGAD